MLLHLAVILCAIVCVIHSYTLYIAAKAHTQMQMVIKALSENQAHNTNSIYLLQKQIEELKYEQRKQESSFHA